MFNFSIVFNLQKSFFYEAIEPSRLQENLNKIHGYKKIYPTVNDWKRNISTMSNFFSSPSKQNDDRLRAS